MIARLLSPFADARLRRILRRALTGRDKARQEVRVIKAELAQSRAAEQTNYDLAQRWKSIAQRARTDIRDRYEQIARLELQVARLETQCNEQMHQLAAERARTQETHQ